MQVLMPPDPCVYLIDIHNLQEGAFKAETSEGLSLRALLQSDKSVKIFFDVRNDSDALYSHFDVNLSCVVDLQMLEYVTRPGHGKFLNGLVKCVSQLTEIGMAELAEWKTVKDQGQKLIAPERGGRYEVLQERPLSADVVKYCVQDVLMLPKLLLSYSRRLHPSLAMKAHEETLRRIRLSQEPGFNGKGPHMARAPVHIWQSTFGQFAQVPFPMNIMCSPDLEKYRSVAPNIMKEHGTIEQIQNYPPQPENGRKDEHIPGDEAKAPDEALDTSPTETEQHVRSRPEDANRSSDQLGPVAQALQTMMDTPSSAENSDEGEEDRYGYRSTSYRGGYYRDSSESPKSYTACSASDCGYCGHCGY
ncbi:hypothetical protein LTR47_011485 [Exophiala xenobiotica]|nr:hypothetical protein LTR47_011485 [Exophiala xenobiotica]KAK5243989.1 hypothetical protein LTS06_010357 [Exophiala xenobiotica]KAK5320642.1 hypothetical protein LTR93_006854 [Exophiala xenobiotica]KAK5351871.1 hypothetical protein LTR61_004121 [Exophiala xenobiotica]KAK5371373.1 hypothetical protein LTR11_006400 [Exophiala xenobiotica]